MHARTHVEDEIRLRCERVSVSRQKRRRRRRRRPSSVIGLYKDYCGIATQAVRTWFQLICLSIFFHTHPRTHVCNYSLFAARTNRVRSTNNRSAKAPSRPSGASSASIRRSPRWRCSSAFWRRRSTCAPTSPSTSGSWTTADANISRRCSATGIWTRRFCGESSPNTHSSNKWS